MVSGCGSRALARCHRIAIATQEPLYSRALSACESGEGHSSYALYGRKGQQRFSIHVPDEFAPELEHAIRNGRQIHELMIEAGRRYAVALKNKRRSRRS